MGDCTCMMKDPPNESIMKSRDSRSTIHLDLRSPRKALSDEDEEEEEEEEDGAT